MINSVHIVPAEEKYAPSSEIIELVVVSDDADQLVRGEETEDGEPKWYGIKRPRQLVLLSLSDYEETTDVSTLTRKQVFPAIDLNDLLRALSSFGVGVQSWHVGDPPVRVSAPLAEEPTPDPAEEPAQS